MKKKIFPWKNPFKAYKESLFLYEIIKFDKGEEVKDIDLKPKTTLKKFLKKLTEIKPIKDKSLLNQNNMVINSKNSIEKNIEKEHIIKNIRDIKKEAKRKLIEIELRNKVEIPPISTQNMKKLIYNPLTKIIDIKLFSQLNIVQIHDIQPSHNFSILINMK